MTMSVYRAAGLLLLALTPAWAQLGASISGKVEDPAGMAVSGATVTVKNAETEAVRTVSTDESGTFRVLSLPVGPYEVKVEKAGFKTQIRGGVNLEVGQTAVVNLNLQ